MVTINYGIKNGKFNTQDSRININANDYGIVKFQIQGNNTSSYSNLKWESTASGSSAARLGKSPVDMVVNLLNHYGLSFINDHNRYPKTMDEFSNEKQKYIKMFEDIKKNKIEVGISNSNDFVKNLSSVFLSIPHVANSKLMQLTFIYEISKLPKDKLDSFMTDLTFISMKKGPRFGPFGKIY